MMRKCNLNTCPMGVATQDPKLRAHFRGSYKYLINYFRFMAEEVREYLAEMGYTSLNDIIGHTELIVRKSDAEVLPIEGENTLEPEVAKSIEEKADLLDFSRLLHREAGHGSLYHTTAQIHDLDNVLDQQLIRGAQSAIEKQEEVNLDFAIKNTDRAAGAMLSGLIAEKYGEAGLPDKTVNVKFKGSAGQSFGAFLVKGVDFKLEGETNDYFAKGLLEVVFPSFLLSAAISLPRTISSLVTQVSMVPQVVNFTSTVRWVSASVCVTRVPSPSSRVQATTAVST